MAELYPGAIWTPSIIGHPNRIQTLGVVIHWTAGGLALSTLQGKDPGHRVDVQFDVGKDGRVYQFVPLESRAWHASTTANNYCVGIETEGRGEAWTPAQFEAVSRLTAWICRRWDIPIRRTDPTSSGNLDSFRGIFGHRDLAGIDGNNHTDSVPSDTGWAEFIERVRIYAAGGEPDAFFFEEFPHNDGGLGPVVVGPKDGFANKTMAEAYARVQRALGRLISTVNDGERVYLLWWADGTYGIWFRSQGFDTKEHRDTEQDKREKVTGRKMRPYRGPEASYYPRPA